MSMLVDSQSFPQFGHMNGAAGQHQIFQKEGFPQGPAGMPAAMFPQQHQQQQPQQQHLQHPAMQQMQQQMMQQQMQLPMHYAQQHQDPQQQMFQQQQQQQQHLMNQQRQQQQQMQLPLQHPQHLQQPMQQPFAQLQQPLHPQAPVIQPLPPMGKAQPPVLQTGMPLMPAPGTSPANKSKQQQQQLQMRAKAPVKKMLIAPQPDEDAADDINEDDIANMPPSKKRPCVHNEWDDVRTRKGSKILRCRICQRKWKLSSTHVPRCLAFLRSHCPAGVECQQLHVHKKKSGLKERFEQFGVAVLNAMPPQAKLAAEDTVGAASRRASTTTASSSTSGARLQQSVLPGDDRRVSVVDDRRRASVATTNSEMPSLLSGQDNRRPSLAAVSETTVGYETRRTSLAISEYDRRASVISDNLVLPEGLHHHNLFAAHNDARRCSTISELNETRRQQIMNSIDTIRSLHARNDMSMLQSYAFGLPESAQEQQQQQTHQRQVPPQLQQPHLAEDGALAGRRAFAAPGIETNSPTEADQRRSSGGSCASNNNNNNNNNNMANNNNNNAVLSRGGTSPMHDMDMRKSPVYAHGQTGFNESLTRVHFHPSGLPINRSRGSMCSDGPVHMPAQPGTVTSPLASSPNGSASPVSSSSFNKQLAANPENSGVHAMTEDEVDEMLSKHEANIIRRKSLDPDNVPLGATI